MRTKALLLLATVICLLVLSHGVLPSTRAQSGGYDVSWYVIGGAGVSGGGEYALSGTAGQAGADTLAGGDYQLVGGFWPGVGGTAASLYLPLIVR